jgi:hypothetical protein
MRFQRSVFGLGRVIPALLTIALGFSALHHGEAAPQRSEQSLLIERHGNEPLELIDVKIGDRSVKSKIKSKWRIGDDGYDEAIFGATEEWPKDIRLRVRNISGKQLTGFQAYIYLKRPAGQVMFSVTLKGAGTTQLEHTALAPGQEIEAEVDPDSWNRAIIRFARYGGEVVSAEVRLSIGLVGFGDGLYWNNGHMVRQDPNNPNRYIPVETKRP